MSASKRKREPSAASATEEKSTKKKVKSAVETGRLPTFPRYCSKCDVDHGEFVCPRYSEMKDNMSILDMKHATRRIKQVKIDIEKQTDGAILGQWLHIVKDAIIKDKKNGPVLKGLLIIESAIQARFPPEV